ncbi:MAG: hypothetical protein M1832_000548 [Thelocarpon impressellum]|nr:MAG: hypothetical protein M1832_000548 [Thelocarpon impressellum]
MPSEVSESSLARATLPDARSPTLTLGHPTEAEKTRTAGLNGAAWRGALSIPAYQRRETHLGSQLLTRDDGITHWVLVDPAEPLASRRVLASCESIRKRALVAVEADGGRPAVREVVTHGIGGVFCAKELRGRGYAGRMMELLGRELPRWQVDREAPGREKCLFSVLYSDIGKNYYAAHGWHPFSSNHLSLPPLPPLPGGAHDANPSALPATAPLHASALPGLCATDEHLLRRHLSTSTRPPFKVRVALIPDYETIQWHHAREEFVAGEIWPAREPPAVKGALVSSDGAGSRAWCVWTRMWYSAEEDKAAANTLHILRLVVEDSGSALANGHAARHDRAEEDKVVALLLAAQREAAAWNTADVQIWNPDARTQRAAQRALEISSHPGSGALLVCGGMVTMETKEEKEEEEQEEE